MGESIDNKFILTNPPKYSTLSLRNSDRPKSYVAGKETCDSSSGTNSAIKIVIKNYLEFEAVYFMRGNSQLKLYNDPIKKDKNLNLLNRNPEFDCSVYDDIGSCLTKPPYFNCQPAGKNITFYFRLPAYKKESPAPEKVVYLHGEDAFGSGIIWAAPWKPVYMNRCAIGDQGASDRQINLRDIALGPYRQSGAEFTISTLDSNGATWGAKVSYDATFVNGVSYGVNITYTDNCNRVSKIVASTDKQLPKTLEKNIFLIADKTKVGDETDVNFPSLLSDQYTADNNVPKFVSDAGYSYTNLELAQCASNLAYIPSAQHFCRLWYWYKYQEKDSYCSWIRDSEMQAYCWAMDEWICKDKFCGATSETSSIEAPTYKNNDSITSLMDKAFGDPGSSNFVVVQLDRDAFSGSELNFKSSLEINLNKQLENVSKFSKVKALNYSPTGAFRQVYSIGLNNTAFNATNDLTFWTPVTGNPYGIAIESTNVPGKSNYTPQYLGGKKPDKEGEILGIKLAYGVITDPTNGSPFVKFGDIFNAIQTAYGTAVDNTTLKLEYDVGRDQSGKAIDSIINVIPMGAAPRFEVYPVIGNEIRIELQNAEILISTKIKELLPKLKSPKVILNPLPSQDLPPLIATYVFTPAIPNSSVTSSEEGGENSKLTIVNLIKNKIATIDPHIIFKTEWSDSDESSLLKIIPIDIDAISFLIGGLLANTSPVKTNLLASLRSDSGNGNLNIFGETDGNNGEENRYSCGFDSFQPDPTGTNFWWQGEDKLGAENNTVTVNGNKEGRNPAPLRYGGTFEVEFTELSFLKKDNNGGGGGNNNGNKPSPPSTKKYNKHNSIVYIIFGVIGGALLILIIAIIGLILFFHYKSKSF